MFFSSACKIINIQSSACFNYNRVCCRSYHLEKSTSRVKRSLIFQKPVQTNEMSGNQYPPWYLPNFSLEYCSLCTLSVCVSSSNASSSVMLVPDNTSRGTEPPLWFSPVRCPVQEWRGCVKVASQSINHYHLEAFCVSLLDAPPPPPPLTHPLPSALWRKRGGFQRQTCLARKAVITDRETNIGGNRGSCSGKRAFPLFLSLGVGLLGSMIGN